MSNRPWFWKLVPHPHRWRDVVVGVMAGRRIYGRQCARCWRTVHPWDVELF